MPIGREELEKAARLSRIALKEEEAEELLDSLNPLVLLAESLCALPLEQDVGQERGQRGVFRPDLVQESTERDLLLACAPQKREGFFLFEPVLKEGEATQ